jgi:acyl-CoA reductase-like NAD-dependent aldehyde dehydrogenase
MSDNKNRRITPTLLGNTKLDSPLWQEEIFGPILPIMEYSDLNEAIRIVNSKAKPLALYIFTGSTKLQQKILKETSSGGVCINDTVIHLTSKNLPFGGIGESGMGNYHGKASFETFSHMKSVMANTMLFDPKFKYPPYKLPIKIIKRVLKML